MMAVDIQAVVETIPSIDMASIYRQVSNIRRTKSQHLKYYHTVLRLPLPNPLKPDVKSRMIAPTTSEWSTILLPTKVRLILEVLR